MKDPIFALVDCNNFYASCERVFNPKISKLPVIVLSNNDGCVVARSNEVKKLDIKIGTPVFKCKELINDYKIQVFSSNYTLYADMSRRVMEVLQKFAYDIEFYSIDEAFLRLDTLYREDYQKYGEVIRNTVTKWTGIPVSIGIAKTKCLSKVANEIAKKHKKYKGVVNMIGLSEKELDYFLDLLDVSDVWGVGPAYSKKLKYRGIKTAKDLKYADLKWMRRISNVMVERIVLELRGRSCYELDQGLSHNKGICSSRSFGKPVTTKKEMSEAVASYTAMAAEKLRRQKAHANIMIVFIKTNRFKKGPKYSNSAYVKFIEPTSSTIDLTRYALFGLDMIFKSGYKYQKAGVLLEGIQSNSQEQLSLLYGNDSKKRKRVNVLMKVMDGINRKYGRGFLRLSSEGIKKKWDMRRHKLSKRFTTSFDELLEVST